MDNQPRHAQPFSFAQLLELEIPIITEEISRLQNSLKHLNRTQRELNEHLSGLSECDNVLLDALNENDAVIASQKERISMLKTALEAKGLNPSSGHYSLSDINGTESSAAFQNRAHVETLQVSPAGYPIDAGSADHNEGEDGGMYL